MNQPRPAFAIRFATPTDAAALTVLRVELFREIGNDAMSPQAQTTFENLSTTTFADAIERGICHAWLAESDTQQAIGSVALMIFPRLPTPDSPALREGFLVSIYTVPEWRGRGVAAAMVAAAVAKARALGLVRIRLHATASGQRVYADQGFRLRDDEMELRL